MAKKVDAVNPSVPVSSKAQNHDYEGHYETPATLLNLQIQHAWGLMALNLRALSSAGIENIAAMTESQRSIALAAKHWAERHLHLLLTRVPVISEGDGAQPSRRYLASFKWAMDFVWAKCAFSVLLVLRLGMLLGDPTQQLLGRVNEAQELLEELGTAGGTNVSYYRILALSVEKCERALKEALQQQQAEEVNTTNQWVETGTGSMRSIGGDSAAEKDFQTYVPKEFLFEWAFPGLNLCYVPLDWQDLFVDFGAVFT
ncbi:hypothetical protein M8818_007020 [Zalaria obscura]|uniref:Uncharacterized protein n=1 Tax=Zalaria obscura TaxID=2024903 RepID=A0ACC3S5N7_9PEZI